MSDMTYLGQVIKALRNQKRWTQVDLAEKSGVSKKTIENIESGKQTNPEFKTLVSIFNALECESIPIDSLCSANNNITKSLSTILSATSTYDQDTLKLVDFVMPELIKLVKKIQRFPRG